MMTVLQSLKKIKAIQIPKDSLPVEETSAREIIDSLQLKTSVVKKATENSFKIAVADNADFPVGEIAASAQTEKNRAFFRLNEKGEGELIVTHPSLLYAYATKITGDWAAQPVARFKKGSYFTTPFRWHRPLFDYLLTQMWRTARHFDPETHIREIARAGYTHVEVNGLAAPVPFERAVPGEFYSQFYSYSIALDQYVYSELNKGLYPVDYLTANLSLLKKYAAIGRKYGLQPGMVCFEPRSVPEKFFEKYPTLRGARVDHPFRSRMPRYSLALSHPLVKQHYTELLQKIMREIPDLAYMSVWSNDSGAGFEYTSSLYVGRNGGPYMIREWRTHEQIAEVAGKNIVGFLKTLRNAAKEINPEFRVSLRLEPFKVEHDTIMAGLEEYLDIEVPSLLVRGYDLPYHHVKYTDVTGIAGSVHHLQMTEQEKELIAKNRDRKIASHLVYSHGNGFNFEPLTGVAFPWMLHEKLLAMKESGVDYAANLGGFTPSSLAPYHITQEVYRGFMLEPETDIDQLILKKAVDWAGKSSGEKLVAVWRTAEQALRRLPPLPLYSNFGFVWLRLWVRPIIPDLLAPAPEERRYYEDYMVSSGNNTNLSDLGRDVLFDLITTDSGAKYISRVDKNVLPRLDEAIRLAQKTIADVSIPFGAKKVFTDQRDRLKALRCWIMVQRNISAWVVGVNQYLDAKQPEEKSKWRSYLDEMMDQEIRNTKDLLALWQTSDVDFMVVSATGENSYMYGENIGDLLQKKIDLMQKYGHVEPRIDKDIIWRV